MTHDYNFEFKFANFCPCDLISFKYHYIKMVSSLYQAEREIVAMQGAGHESESVIMFFLFSFTFSLQCLS